MPRAPRHIRPPLRRADLAADPWTQFAEWYDQAELEVPLADAMTLATAGPDGPDARMVLLKGHSPDGFRFFTNYRSDKAAQLDANPRAAIVLYWRELDRQVRARGPVERLPAAESDAYFATRPPDSRLGAWASPQSRVIPGREELETLMAEARERFGDGSGAPRPEHWGGYVLRPDAVEFWQGQEARLHDRFRYRREADGWAIERLAP